MESIEHVENGEMLFRIFAQALKPGGRLIISAPNAEVVDLAKNPYHWHHRHYARHELVELGRRNGLDHLRCAGTDCTIINTSGKVVAANYHSPVSGKMRDDHPGDTLVHLFIKQM